MTRSCSEHVVHMERSIMATTHRRAVVAVLCAVALGACSTWEQQNRTTKGAVYGAGAGAAAGSAIGAIAGGGQGAWKGAAIGAAVGALGGGLMGNYMDKQANEMQQVLSEQDRLRRQQDTIYVSLGSDVLFESGKATLQPGARTKLHELAGIMEKYPETTVTIVGHTDSRGSDELNDRLSKDRAQAVADELIADGVAANRIVTRGAGATQPIASNATPEGRQQNRRVDITVAPSDSLRAQSQQQQQQSAPPPAEEPK
jgi:outer membrane protein OmpA-like peptidoglycan-associated protein